MDKSFYAQMQEVKQDSRPSLQLVKGSSGVQSKSFGMREFLKTVLPETEQPGDYVIWVKDKYPKNIHCDSIDNVQREALRADKAGNDVYICLSKNQGTGRKTADATLIKSLFIDIDCGHGKPYQSPVEAIQAITSKFRNGSLPNPTFIVNSGYGVHLYWVLQESMKIAEWQPIAIRFKQLFSHLDIYIDSKVTADPVRVLRIPGTHNYKRGGKKPVELVENTEILYEPATVINYIPTADTSRNAEIEIVDNPNTVAEKINSWIKNKKWCGREAWKAEIKIGETKQAPDGSYINLSHCLFHVGHDVSHSPAIFLGNDGNLGWACQGEKCSDITWRNVRKLLDPSFVHSSSKVLLEEDEALEFMNSRYFMAHWGGNFVTAEIIDNNPVVRKDSEFRKQLANRKVKVGSKLLRLCSWWEQHEQRRDYTKVIFDPSKPPGAGENIYNLWKGFSVAPVPGDWRLMNWHIKNIICDSDPKLIDNFFNWVALLVQQPGKHHGSSIILKSEKEGTGKGIVMGWFQKIFGEHAYMVNKQKRLLGDFNRHLENKVFIAADEPTYAGDHSASNTLKSMITENNLAIEPKGLDSYQIKNRLSLMIATNEDWVINAGLGARRFLVCEVNSRMADNHDYFDKLCGQADNGGIEAMLHDLLRRDISNYNSQVVYRTRGLTRQRLLSLDPVDSLIYQMYEDDTATPYAQDSGTLFYPLGVEVPCDVLHAEYQHHCKSINKRYPLPKRIFAMKISARLKVQKSRKSENNVRRSIYSLPSRDQLKIIVKGIIR